MGDNVGGGSPGDGTLLIHAWRVHAPCPLFAVLYDPAAVQAAEKLGVQNRGRIAVGGKIDDRHGPPVHDDFLVVRLSEGRFRESEPRHGGYQIFDQGATAILQSSSGLTLMATSRRVAPLSLQQLLSQGIDPQEFAAIVIKGVHAPVAAYAPVCQELLRVNTPGATCADLGQFPYAHRRQPMYPFEPFTSFAIEHDESINDIHLDEQQQN